MNSQRFWQFGLIVKCVPHRWSLLSLFVHQVTEENVTIDNIDYNTKFTIIAATRKQSGIYKVRAENKHGVDEADVEITVLCEW